MVNTTFDPTVNGLSARHQHNDLVHEAESADFCDLVNIGINALKIRPPRYVKSILGAPGSWVPRRRQREW